MNTKTAGIKAHLRLQSRFKGLTYFFWSKKKCWKDGQPKSKGEKVLLVSDFPNFWDFENQSSQNGLFLFQSFSNHQMKVF